MFFADGGIVGEFIANNLALVALFVASGAMLVWPEISRLMGAGAAEIGTLEATRLMNQGPMLVLDVRDEKEFAEGHLPKAKPVIVTCRGGARAGAACRLLRQSGFTNVYQLKGGLNAWQQASLPVEK